jgi:hypothetical protein
LEQPNGNQVLGTRCSCFDAYFLEKLGHLFLEKKNYLVAAKILNGAIAIFQRTKNNTEREKKYFTQLESIEKQG